MGKSLSRPVADFSLLAVACVWGLTFPAVKYALDEISPFTFNFYRFMLSAVFLAALAPRRLVGFKKETFLAGTLLGLFLFGGYSFQTVGLLYTTAANAGFLTGLVVVFVPLFLAFITGSRPSLTAVAGALCAFGGVAVLSLGPGYKLNSGDILVITCAACFALQLIYLGRFCRKYSLVQLVLAQVVAIAFLSGLAALALENVISPARFSLPVWAALLVTSGLATTTAFFVQAYMQRFTTAVRTAVILSAEPVFAAVFASLLLNEALSARIVAGGGMVLAGMLLAESKVFPSPCLQKLSVKRGE